ncbi:MAG: DUF2986 domain-containing protein [Shewanella sp.]
MNRKKKINQTLKHKAKKANAKLQTARKPQYIAKAQRAAEAGAGIMVEAMAGAEAEPKPLDMAEALPKTAVEA